MRFIAMLVALLAMFVHSPTSQAEEGMAPPVAVIITATETLADGTKVGVQPTKIEIEPSENVIMTQVGYLVTFAQVNSDGIYTVKVEADGYADAQVTFTIAGVPFIFVEIPMTKKSN